MRRAALLQLRCTKTTMALTASSVLRCYRLNHFSIYGYLDQLWRASISSRNTNTHTCMACYGNCAVSSHGCHTRRLREYNGELAAGSSVLLLPSTAITNQPAQRGDYGQILQLGEAVSPAVNCNRLL
ncbi:jg22611 [Pararge aegeria aegeria]|uniref:Jg22611 protein n=1 Tax=Pararge aegeria aegeria TaxID=348720 RepID=A0A8S4SME1_9NEOP|nr:jg22611 [Pararge aegeria aegeria]